MEFQRLYNEALWTLHGPPLISRKRRRGLVAVINTQQQTVPYWGRPDLLARFMAVLKAREARLIRRYSPHDPNRLP